MKVTQVDGRVVIHIHSTRELSNLQSGPNGIMVTVSEVNQLIWLAWSSLNAAIASLDPCDLELDFGRVTLILEYDHPVHMGSALSAITTNGKFPSTKNAADALQSTVRKYVGETK